MKVGLIADIHGNIAALDAVLNDMPPVDAIVCAGDVVGYNTYPNEVCVRLQQLGAHVVRGNHDCYVTGRAQFRSLPSLRVEWTRDNLRPENFEWLATLPAELRFDWGGRKMIVRHASPWDEETYLYPDSPRLDDVRLAADEILVLGHTHHPMIRSCGEGLLINPGSVGQPRDRDPRPSYMNLDIEARLVEHRRV